MADDKYLQNRQLAYDLLKQEGYTDIGDSAEELFKDRGNSELAYNLLSKAGYTDIGKDYNEFANMLYGPEQKSKTQSRTSRFNEMARQRDEARNANRPTMSQSEVAAFEEKQAADMRARQQRMAERRAQAQKPAEEPVEQVAEPVAEEPVRSNEEMLAEIAGLHEQYDPIISEYERRLNEHKNTLDIGSKKNKENEDWLYAHRDEYRAAKQAVDEAQGRLNLATREEDMERLEAKRKENRSGMPTPQDVVAQRLTPFSRTEKYGDNPERQAAEELYGMAEQTLKQGSKYAPGYEGNALEKIWTAASQFAGGAANNFDKGSLTFGASEGAALKTAREVGEKNNRIVEDTIKSLGYDDKQVDAILSTRDEDVKNLNALTGELEKESGEIESMQRTYEDMVRRGDPKAASYGREYKKKVDAYNKRIKGEYEPAYNKFLEDSKEYETIMSAVGTAVDEGLTDGEKAVLDALEEFTSAKIKRSGDVSVASAAGAGAEQSAEFMLDFILTGGMEKIGTKAAAKLASKRIVKNALGETGAKIAARGLADAGVSLARTAVMFPRNLSAYGEQLVQMTGGVDDMGRYQFDRTRENAALNTALTQYIEYWSEGFGEYFGAGEKFIFENVTKKAPRTAIGKTLSQYRGSIGQYLDKGKFNGMFNEMLEEVVGSGMNALSGWMSNDRVGDKDAMKEFVAGEQLATLALSFLPMSVISARTNLKAYNKMKERYDEGVRFLNPFLKSGAIDRQELEDLVSTISEKTPEEIKDAVVSIADKARAANGGRLPDDFTTSLMGYLEGEFAMSLKNDVWENSAENMDVVNSYTQSYYNPNPASAYDLAQEEKSAYDSAVEAGFSEDELELDSYMLAQQAASMKEAEPERAQVLMDYAMAKASASGLKDGYDRETTEIIKKAEEPILQQADNEGLLIYATAPDGTAVFITSKDATADANGNVSSPTGPDGLVTYIDHDGQSGTAKAKDINDAGYIETDWYLMDLEDKISQQRNALYEQALSTVSPLGQSRNLAQLKGQNVFVTGSGAYEPVRIERLTNNGQSVVISGDKEALKGIATAAGINSPGGTYLEIPVQSLYPMLAKDDDGALSTDMEMPEATASTQMPESAPQSPAGVEDLVGAETSIVMNGQPTDVFVTEVSDGRVFFDVEDAEGNASHFDMPVAEFERAMNGEEAPVAEPAPAPAPAEAPAQEEAAVPQNGTIPVNAETGKKIYDDPSVTPEMAYEDLYGSVEEGSKAEENRDKWVIRKSDEADKAVKDAEKLVASGEEKKKAIDNWDIKDNEDLEDLEARQNKAKEKVDAEIGSTQAELPELRRRAAFWNELKEVAEANAEARRQQAERQKIIDQYGVDVRGFDLEPRSMEELLARELSDFFRSGQRLSRESVLDLVGHNMVKDLRKGGYAFVLSNDGVPVDKFVMDVDASYPGFIKDEQDAVNMVGDLLMHYTRGELGQFIFNNRLEEAKKLMLEMENEEEQAQEPETPATPEQPEVPETPVEEPQTPAEETAEEAPEDLPEDMPEEIAEPEPVAEETVEEQPETENPAETPAPKTERNGAEKTEKPSESPEKPISSPEKGVRIPATAGEIRNVAEARAFFENQYGKGKRADNSVRVWELTHKQTAPVKNEDDGGLSNMAMSLATEGGLSEEEAAELITLGTQLAEDFIVEDGYVKFPQFFKNLVETFGDNIRPFSKSIYLGASANVPDEVADQMDDRKTVRAFDTSVDLNDISDVQDSNADIREGEGGVSEPVAGADGEGGQEEPVGDDGQPETGDTSDDSGEGRGEVGELDFGDDTGADSGSERGQSDATPKRRGRGGRSSNDGGSTGRGSKGNRPSGQRESGNPEGVGRDTGRVEETDEQKEAKAKAAEDAAYEAEKERIKDETDTNELKSQFESIKEKLTGLTDVFDTERAKLMGRLRALREKLQQLFSSKLNKSDALAREKVPYDPVSDSTGEHAIGSVVPSGSADYMRDALKRLEAEVGKPVAEYVQEELGYKSLDEMFTSDGKDIGLSAEQVDAVGLAIHQIKTGRVFIVGDMTGVGKGRVAAALIRWGKRNKKKVLFCTEQPNLFSAMNADLEDIGSAGMVPFIINNSAEANITNSEGTVIVRHPAPNVYSTLFESGKDELPTVQSGPNKGKQYDFVMTTYSQLQASEEEEEGDSDKVKKKNERNKKGRQRLNWLKNYAKDAVLIMDESHTAAGEGSTRGENAKKLVEVAQGVTFLSATFAKTPESMSLYAIRSSMNDAMITRDQLIAAISKYGIPMQEILAASLFKTGEMVRRERDFDGVKTNWLAPDETYTKEEIETTRGLSDRTVEVINSIIDFQRRYVEPVIRKMNDPLKASNEAALKSGAPDVYVREYDTTPYSGQVSNVVSMMLFALKAKKAAELAIEQIKRGEKPVIAVDNTLGAYVDQIEGNIESADFGAVLMKGLAFALRYQLNTNHMKLTTLPNGMQVYKKVEGDRQVEKFESIENLLGENGANAIKELATQIEEYGRETLAMDLPLSPIDYIIKKIQDAGYKCGEITKRQNALVQNEDGTWSKKPIKHNKKDVINRFNGGTAKSPLPKVETYDAVVMNRSGATGNSMHASRRFGDQRPRKMIILQAAKDPNNEVQIRGRIDRTGQVVRGEYFYVISPIPAEKKITMMLKQKLASLDATSVGSEKVASNRVEAEDMDNKYGDDVARDFLVDHEEIHLQMDPAKQMKKNRRTGEYVGRPGLLYDLLLSMQRMTCAEQEMILNELEEAYAQKIEYLNQNGINDLATTTMNLDATTVDKAIMVKGKDNDALSEFAHDTSIERMEVNVLRKPMRSEDIAKKIKELGGLEKHTRTNSWGETEDVSYGDFIQQNAREAVDKLKDEKKAKQAEAEEKLAADIREEMPKEDSFTEEQYEEAVQNDPRLASLRLRNMNEYARYEMQLDEQLRFMRQATSFFKPGRAYLVPLNESEGAQNMYGRFLGYKAGKDGRPKSVEAVFATKDSRAMVSIPLINMHKIIDTIRTNSGGWTDIFGKSDSDYASEEARLAEYDKWWDRMIPANTSRSIRYMITGNILQAAGSLAAYRGTITTFTRKDAETGEVTVDKGLLLAEDFDPENFVVRTEVTKEDVWETPGEFSDPLTNIAVFREGDRLAVKFTRERGSRKKLSDHPVMSDDEFKALCVGNEIIPYGADELRAYVSEENAAEALDYLYKNYGFTQGHLLVMPDSTEKPDRIVYTNKPYRQVIDELQPKYRGVYGSSGAQREIDKALKTFKMDVTNEDLKEKIRELVQLRQAYIRRDYANLDDADLATQVIISEQKADKLGKAEPNESPEEAKARKENRNQYIYLADAFREELGTRGYEKEGHLKHYKQGKTALDTMIDAFEEFNTDEENAKIAKRVFGIMRKLNANYFFDEKASEDLGGQTRGDYVGYNWRYMNEAWVADQLKANTILHEMLHTATVYPFEAMQRAADHLVPNVIEEAKQADALFRAINQNKAFRHQIGEDSYESYTDYGVRKNAKEMLAETGANQKFRDDLAKVKVLVRVVNSFGQTAYQFTDVTDNPNATGGKVMTALEASMDILDRMLNAFDPEAYRKVWTGTGYGEMSYRENALEKKKAFEKAYHGSVANFLNFDSDYAGSGEGAQAHGYGHYVALQRGTAEGYAMKNAIVAADRNGKVNHWPEVSDAYLGKTFSSNEELIEAYDKALESAQKNAKKRLEDAKKNTTEDAESIKDRQWEYDTLSGFRPLSEILEGTRNLYTVEIPEDNGGNYIHENEEVPKEQLERIRDEFVEYAKTNPGLILSYGTKDLQGKFDYRIGPGTTGRQLYTALSGLLGRYGVQTDRGDREASKFLHSIGYAGIKYVGEKDGPCAVIFSNDDLNISDKYVWREGADTPEKRRIADAELAATNRTLDSMGEALGVKINRVGRDGMPKGHKTAKGYFDPRTGEMTICMDNVTDERDAVATVLHETVGHKGLRELFGAQFNDAMVRIYAALDNKGKMWVNAYMARHDLQPGDTDSIIRGMEEYMAHLAESGDFKRSVWDDIKEILGKIVDLLFGTDGFTFTDRELNYILRASYEHLKNPNWLNTPLGKAQDTLWKRELGINETDPNRPTDPDGPGTGILYRDGETENNALGNYEAGLARKGTAMITENQNADLPVKIGMEAVMKEVGMTELREDMDYLQRHNLASSRADTEAHDFELFRFTPMLEQVREVQSKLVGENATNEDREDAYNEIRDYLYAVSGLERNNYKNNEIEQAKKDALANADSAFKTAVDAIENNDKLSDNDKSAEIAKLEKKLAEKKKEIEEKYEAMKKDWSGLTGLTGHVETEWREAEDDARKLIKDFKRKVGDNVVLNELWNRIRACTDYSLEHAYKHGLLTRDEYEKLHGTATQPRMWNYYLPLRGFAQGTAEDVYSYSTFLNPSTNSVVTRKMKGRKTEADDPLATILNIAETEIVQGNDNWAKQALLKFVQSAGNNSLLTEKEPWYVKDTVTGKWSLGIPEESETLEHFEARMQELREKGEAKKGRRGLKLENIMANKAHRNEHLIHVKVGGLDKMIWVNGNPALSKAVTGFGKKQSYQWIRRASRVLSNLFTTYSLDFSVKNLIRDTLYSRVALAVKEDREYRRKFSENWWKNGGVTAAPIIRLAAMWNSGELQRIPEDQRTERQQLFIDFMHDGGQTGYTIINSVNTIKRSLERSMRRAGKEIKEAEFPVLGVRIPLFDDYAKLVSTLNEGFELLTRFTAYQTSRQSGRSGQRSASDAKEISVNFNRRGAQSNEGFWGHIAAFLGGTHYFYNAGVQGFDNYLRLFKANTKKMSTLTAGFMVMGILTPLVNSLIASATGGGDDDWYWNIPEWVRRNNIIIGWKGTYIALPLPVEFRAPYGIGDITGSAFVWHKYANRKGGKMLPFGDLALDLLSTASNILPVNPVEGYEGSRNIGDAVLRAVAPDATMFIVDLATNRDYTGRPLWKENPFSETTPKCFGAYASTPKGIVNACQKLSELTYNRIDIAPGAVRDFMNNYGGGFFRTAEDVSKILRPLVGDLFENVGVYDALGIEHEKDLDRPFRWDNIPFFSGFTGHIDQDRSDSYAKNALNEYRQNSEEVVARINAVLGRKDVTTSMAYDDPESLYELANTTARKARLKNVLSSKDYELGKMYRDGMNNEYEMVQYVRGDKIGQWHKSNKVKRAGVDALKQDWLKLRDEWVKMPSKTAEEKSAKALVQTDVENAWHVYYDAEANLADELMKKEYGK